MWIRLNFVRYLNNSNVEKSAFLRNCTVLHFSNANRKLLYECYAPFCSLDDFFLFLITVFQYELLKHTPIFKHMQI